MLRAALAELPSRANWNQRYLELVEYKREHGDCCVPKANGPLGRWVARQRELAKKRVLPRDRRAKLDELDFVWNTNDEAWDARYKQLLAWAEQHGHACVPIANGDLGLWVAKQRQMKRKGKLAPERERLLNEARFTWDTPSADWNEKFAELVRWKEEHGDCRVPFNSPSADGLGWWVNTQRQARRKGKMTRERQERLDAIGFIWSPQETARTSRASRLTARVTSSSSSSASVTVAARATAASTTTAAATAAASATAATVPTVPTVPTVATSATASSTTRSQNVPSGQRTVSVMEHGCGSPSSVVMPAHDQNVVSPSRSSTSSRRTSGKRKIDDNPAPLVVTMETGLPPPAPTKRHHSFALGDPPSHAALPGMASSDSSLISINPHPPDSRAFSRRAMSFGVFTPPLPSPSMSPTYLSGSSTPSSCGFVSGDGSSSNSLLHKPLLPPLVFAQPQSAGQVASNGRPPPMSPPQNSVPSGHQPSSSSSSSPSMLPFNPLPPISSLNPLRSGLYRRRRSMLQDRHRAISFSSLPKSPHSTHNPDAPNLLPAVPMAPLPSQPPVPYSDVRPSEPAACQTHPLTDLANLAVSSGAAGVKSRDSASTQSGFFGSSRRIGISSRLPPLSSGGSSFSGGLFRSLLDRRS